MKNRLLTLLVNPADGWVSDWPFLVVDQNYQPHVESDTEAEVRSILELSGGGARHIMPLLLAFGRHEWSRWLVPDGVATHVPEWFSPSVSEWTGGRIYPHAGKTVWPPVSGDLPLPISATFTRPFANILSMTLSTGDVVDMTAEFRGPVAIVSGTYPIYGQLILNSGSWDIASASPLSVDFHPQGYPWAAVAARLDYVSGLLDLLNAGGTLDVWHSTASAPERVTACAAALVNIGKTLHP